MLRNSIARTATVARNAAPRRSLISTTLVQHPLLRTPNAARRLAPSLATRLALPYVSTRGYAQGPPGGGGPGGGMPGGFSFKMGPQHEKGEALKEYVSTLLRVTVHTGSVLSAHGLPRLISSRPEYALVCSGGPGKT